MALVSFVRHLAERNEGVAGAHIFLGGVDSLSEMVRRTFDRLLEDSIEKPWHKKVQLHALYFAIEAQRAKGQKTP